MSKNGVVYPPLTEEQKKMIEDNFGLAKNFITKSFDNDRVHRATRDDFFSDVMLGFCVSALKYEEDRGFKFSTYAWGGFNLALIKANSYKLFKYKKYHFVSINSLLKMSNTSHNIPSNPADNYYEIGYVHSGEKAISVHEKEVEKDSLNEFMENSGLKDKEKKILTKYFWERSTLKVIGEEYNVSRERIRQIIKKAVAKIRKKMDIEGICIEDFFHAV